MKKSLLALAVLGAFAGVASAQSSVTLFGTLDVAGESSTTKLGDGTSVTKRGLKNNRQGTSQLSFKFVEDLGGGLTTIGLWEGDFDATQQLTTHQPGSGGGEVYVGLRGGFGTVLMGSPNTPTLLAQVNRQPFGSKLGGGFSGNASVGQSGSVLGSAQVRQDQAVRYDSPNLGGLTLMVDAASSQGNASQGAPFKGRVYDLGANYAAGPLSAWATYYKQTVLNNKIMQLTGSYDLGVAAVMLGLHRETSDVGGANNRGWNIGTKIPVSGNLSLLGNYAKLDDKNDANLDKSIFAVGPQYVLSKRSSIYARYVNEKNENVGAKDVKSVATWLMGLQHNF